MVMGRHAAEADAVSEAPREVVWGVLADASRWAEWGIWSSSVLERQGDPAPDGVGAIRVFTKRPVTSREEVVVFEPGVRLVYRLLSGLPVKDYTGTVTLHDHPAGSRISWRSEWESRVPGIQRQLQKVLEEIVVLAAREAERRAATG